MKRWMLDVVLIWFALFGVWPLLNPDHNFDTVAGAADLILHWGAMYWLYRRWEIRRRPRWVTLERITDTGHLTIIRLDGADARIIDWFLSDGWTRT